MTAINNTETIIERLPEFLNIPFTPGLLLEARKESWRDYRSFWLPISTIFASGALSLIRPGNPWRKAARFLLLTILK
jgi:hypothetical protein